MKRAICVLLAAGSAALAGEAEPQGEALPPVPEPPPSSMEIEILPDGTIRLGGRVIAGGLVRARPATCYFIRNMGLQPEGVEPPTVLVPLPTPEPEAGDEPESATAEDPAAPQPNREALARQLLDRLREQYQDVRIWSYNRGPDCINNARLMPIPVNPRQMLTPEPPDAALPPAEP